MGFVTLGFFVVFAIAANSPGGDGARLAMQGGMIQMISHGLISGALFLCVGVMYDRLHSRQTSAYGGVVNTMPKFAALMVLFALANVITSYSIHYTKLYDRRSRSDVQRGQGPPGGWRLPAEHAARRPS